MSDCEWIDASERLPERGAEVLVFGKYNPSVSDNATFFDVSLFDGEDFLMYHDDDSTYSGRFYCITHWMPIKKTPTPHIPYISSEDDA